MLRLIYISTARKPITRPELGTILRSSRKNNVKVDVTGLLVAGERRFLQALEGPSDAVDATFERIRGDARHFAAVVLSRRIVDERAFGTWAMGCQLSTLAGGTGNVATDVSFLVRRIEDSAVRAEFEQFAALQAA